jgi:diguanylate cyclase (GGDEF)-like protein/PAS domain S-box-containing protein
MTYLGRMTVSERHGMDTTKFPVFGLDDEKPDPSSGHIPAAQTETIDLTPYVGDAMESSECEDGFETSAMPFTKLLEALPIPALMMDRSHVIRFVNESCQLIAADYPRLEGRRFASLLASPSSAKTAEEFIERVFVDRHPLVLDGKLEIEQRKLWGRIHLRSIRVGEAVAVLALIDDLTAEKRRLIVQRKSHERLRHAHSKLEERAVELSEIIDELEEEMALREQAETALHQSKKRLSALLNATTDSAFLLDNQGNFLALNQAVVDMLGKPMEELLEQPFFRFLPKKLVRRSRSGLRQVVRTGKAIQFEQKMGDRVFLHSVYPAFNDEGKVDGVAVFWRDITRRKRAEERQQLSFKIMESSNEAILVTDVKGNIVDVNKAFCQMTGFSRGEVIGRNPSIMKSGLHGPKFYRKMWDGLVGTGSWRGEVWDRRKTGELFLKLLSISAVRNGSADVTHYVGIFSDITKMKRTEHRLRHLAHYDPLTGLPNRVLFRDRLQQTLLKAERDQAGVAVMFLDLDGFKDINDTLGHRAGDELLKAVAERLRRCVRKSDTVARPGGDEFTVVLSRVQDAHAAAEVARKMIEQFSEPFLLTGTEVFVTASLGIALYPADGADADRLQQNADTAMYHAKEHGKNRFAFFSSDMNTKVQTRLELESRLRRALASREFMLRYQPILDMKTGRIASVEALLRWIHPERGEILPGEFIPMAEETGLIIPIGEWVLRTVGEQIRTWLVQGLRPVRIAVNISGRQLRQPEILLEVIRSLARDGVDPERLTVELTESMIMEDVDSAVETLRGLKAIGLNISIDDFGTGYSSLSYLKGFPIDMLKIDRSFVQDIGSDPSGEEVVRAIIALAHNLNLKACAEGVERSHQLEVLGLNDCDEWQGFHYSRPLDSVRITDLLRRENS